MIKPWSKVGKPEIIAKDGKRRLIKQLFVDPVKNQPINYTIFSVDSPWPTKVIPITCDLKVIAIKQFRHGVNKVVIELPGGNHDPKESDNSPEAVGKRELYEETGYRANEMIRLASCSFFEAASYDLGFYPFVALGCIKVGNQSTDEGEYIKVKTYDLEEWLEMTLSGKIFDCASVKLTYLALPYILSTDYKKLVKKLLSK